MAGGPGLVFGGLGGCGGPGGPAGRGCGCALTLGCRMSEGAEEQQHRPERQEFEWAVHGGILLPHTLALVWGTPFSIVELHRNEV